MRQHVTVTITEKFIRQFAPCDAGIAEIRPYLPLKISTDPEANLGVASLIVNLPRAVDHSDARWLLTQIMRGPNFVKWCQTSQADTDHEFNSYGAEVAPHDAEDVFVMMQVLAMLADVIDLARARR